MNYLDEANKKLAELLKQYNLQIGFEVRFPIYRILPPEVELAMKILQKHGMNIVFTLKPKTPDSPAK